MSKALTITGVKAVDKKLAQLEKKIQKKVLRQAMRQAMKPLLTDVKEDAPVDTGLLKSSLKIKAGRRSRDTISVVVQSGEGDFRGDTFYASFNELGFHELGADGKRGGGPFHPGTEFMRRAFREDSEAVRQDAIRLIEEGIDKILDAKS